jgi:prepilin-type N-terminal cleavage/methylation domain-containing protein
MRRHSNGGGESGFSLVELMIAMFITLSLMAMASKTLMQCFNVRSRQDSRTAALADVQRALNTLSREVASAGYGLKSNGVVGCSGASATTCDSDVKSIRVRANLNRFSSTPNDADTSDDNEDVKFFLGTTGDNSYIVRYNANSTGSIPQSTVLANRVDALQFHYFDKRVTYTNVAYSTASPNAALITGAKDSAGNAVAEVAPNLAKYVVIAVVVRLPAVGTSGTDSYQPESQEMLVSDVALRNNDLTNY